MAQPVDRPVIVVENRMVDEARQGFLVAAGGGRQQRVWCGRLAAVGLGGLDHAPAGSGSAGRHTDVRGSMCTQVVYPQEGAPD